MSDLPQNMGILERHLARRFPYFAKIIAKRQEDFGAAWEVDFEAELARFFGGDSAALQRATDGYGAFALDALKLQKVFDKERQYRPKSYADVAARVRSFLHDLAPRFADTTVLVVGHQGTKLALDHVLEGTPLPDLVAVPFHWQPGWLYALHVDA